MLAADGKRADLRWLAVMGPGELVRPKTVSPLVLRHPELLHGESLAYRALYTHLGICVLAWPTVVCVEKLDHYTYPS
jgi:hypothetical protein